MIEDKFRLRFSGDSVQDSVTYILVSKFNIMPIILQAKTDNSGGRMMMSMKGEEKDLAAAVEYLRSVGIEIETLDNYVKRDDARCIDCGSCISVCPASAFEMNTDTWDVMLDTEKCVACGSCISACPTHAISLKTGLL
jgi:NAD-dependent dihydropyrimidine dehydrogenase PreA subunit